jgi:acetyl-CoA synthetase
MIDIANIESYDALVENFSWDLPERFNIAHAVCGRHAVAWADWPAIITSHEDGTQSTITYAELQAGVERVATGLLALGVERGDRVAVLLDQGVPAIESFLAAIHVGAIGVPIPPAFAPDAVAYRLRDSGAKVLITDVPSPVYEEAAGHVVICDERGAFPDVVVTERPPCVDTSRDDPAIIFYTSGSTGYPKGVVHAQRLLLGHIPGFQLMFDLGPEKGDVFWTPSVWAWQGSLGDLVLPSLYFGFPVVATPGRYTSERAYRVLEETGITRAFLATAVLRRLANEPPADKPKTALRAICTGGDPLPDGFREIVLDLFGVNVNDDYGLTETSHIAAGCSKLYDTPEKAVGRIMPGRTVAIVDEELNPLPRGEVGQIVSSADDPITMLGYWGKPEATAERLVDGWCLTNDRGVIDEDGYLWYRGRMGLTMKVSGQVIGPEEIEAALRIHPAVADVCVFAEPHAVKGECPTAVIELVDGWKGNRELSGELSRIAKAHLARFAYPRRVLFQTIPRNSSGKIDRAETRAAYREDIVAD